MEKKPGVLRVTMVPMVLRVLKVLRGLGVLKKG